MAFVNGESKRLKGSSVVVHCTTRPQLDIFGRIFLCFGFPRKRKEERAALWTAKLAENELINCSSEGDRRENVLLSPLPLTVRKINRKSGCPAASRDNSPVGGGGMRSTNITSSSSHRRATVNCHTYSPPGKWAPSLPKSNQPTNRNDDFLPFAFASSLPVPVLG